MSFRSVEMQIAIPRVSEAGHVQTHLNQKPVHDQAAMAAKTMQQKERQLQQSTKVDEPAEPRIRDDRQRGGKGKREGAPYGTKGGKAKPNGQAASDANGHPYKGHHIDFTL